MNRPSMPTEHALFQHAVVRSDRMHPVVQQQPDESGHYELSGTAVQLECRLWMNDE